MAVDPATQENIIILSHFIGDLIGGLFDDEDFPFASVWIQIRNGRAAIGSVNVLDDASETNWRTVGNQLVSATNDALDRLGLLDNPGVFSQQIVIGQASGRKNSQLGTGFWVGIDKGSFAGGADRTNISDFERAVEIWFEFMQDNTSGIPDDDELFGGDIDSPGAIIGRDDALNDAIDNMLDGITDSVTRLNDSVNDAIASLTRSNEGFLDGALNVILGGLDGILAGANTSIADAANAIVRLTDVSIGNTERQAIFQQDRIADLAETAIINDGILHQTFLMRAVNVLDTIEETSERANDDYRNIFLAFIQDILDRNLNQRRGMADAVKAAIEGVLGTILEAGGILHDVGAGISEDIIDVLRQIRDVLHLPEIIVTPDSWDEQQNSVWDAIRKILRQRDDEVDALEKFLFEAANLFQLDRETCRDRFAKPTDPEDVSGNLIYFIANLISALMFPLGIAQARAAGCLQMWATENPYQMLPPGDSALAYFRGLIPRDRALFNIRGHGFAAEDDEVLIETARPIPDLQTLTAMWLRGFISENEYTRQILAHGFDPALLSPLKDLAFFIPPAQDLITMAVREVFNKSISVPFGQFDDFPPEFGKWAAKQGISEEWAQNYWAAHWALPSIQMGFEMLHRRVIDESQLKQLMQALDIMPGWRDELIQISYNPFTRIDIRRMNKVGVLSSEDVYEAYLDLGYNEVNARKLQEFVELLNKDDETLASEIADDLTRSNIIGFYRDGIITRLAAQGLMLNAGMNIISIELFLDDADFKDERADRKEDINVILAQAKIGNITIDEARAQLDTLGLETAERDKALVKLQRVIQANVKMPSKADLDKMLASDIISGTEYYDNMQRLGYSDFWIDKYVQLADIKVKDAS